MPINTNFNLDLNPLEIFNVYTFPTKLVFVNAYFWVALAASMVAVVVVLKGGPTVRARRGKEAEKFRRRRVLKAFMGVLLVHWVSLLAMVLTLLFVDRVNWTETPMMVLLFGFVLHSATTLAFYKLFLTPKESSNSLASSLLLSS